MPLHNRPIVAHGVSCLVVAFLLVCQLPCLAVDFQREVRPILASKCFACHGPDDQARAADLRLDNTEGYAAIEPGSRDDSELWQRVISEDADLRMPPSESHEPLSEAQREILGKWIDEGAKYEEHWAFQLPQRQPVQQLADHQSATPAVRGRIDAFVQAKLQAAGLTPSADASREALARRVYLDLTGVPPTPEEVERFVADPSPLAYERLVDQLLASPDYAERWARPWLDLARYADTNGYEKDRPRTLWPYRDWVLQAINADMPYDEFSIRQLAGDMLPGATQEDVIATGFHRNTMINEEGGIDPLEFRFHALTDRVATTGVVWLGLTTGCAQCHTHKFDPITHQDYFAMMALLNNADEIEQEVNAAQLSQQRQAIEADIQARENAWLDATFATTDPESATLRDAYQAWRLSMAEQASDWRIIRPEKMESTSPFLKQLDDGSILASGDVTKRDVYRFEFAPDADTGDLQAITALRLEAIADDSLPAQGPGMAYYEGPRGDFFLSELKVTAGGAASPLHNATHSYGKNGLGSGSTDAANVIDGEGSTGWSTSGAEGKTNRWVANFVKPVDAKSPLTLELVFERHYAAPLGRMRFAVTKRDSDAKASSLPAQLEAYLMSGQHDAVAERELQRHFFATSETTKAAYAEIESLRRRLPAPVRTLVMKERNENPRTTYRHHRGEYLQPKEAVAPGILTAFAPLSDTFPTNRLEFAKWLVSDRNPLVGRVTVDRAWRELFGRGIVHTAGDYGTQSQPPSHPELLDQLAMDLIQGGWSIKRLHRELVLSSAYRRDSARRADASQIDPENRLLAVGPRRRLEAERIRDAMLAASGTLTRRFGGPSVYPPQPASVTGLAYGNTPWPISQGADRYRRSVYTYAKRTAPFAAFTVFDGPTGESCLPRRDVSNSPLQSLTLLNDEMYVELAKLLASDIKRELPSGDEHQLATALFKRLLSRTPSEAERQAIVTFHQTVDRDQPANEDRWWLVARALMNLDEAITTP